MGLWSPIYNPRASRHLPRPLRDRHRVWLPRVTMGRGPWHTLTRFACEPPPELSLQILPVLPASNTSSVLLIPGEIGETVQGCLSPGFSVLLGAAIAR